MTSEPDKLTPAASRAALDTARDAQRKAAELQRMPWWLALTMSLACGAGVLASIQNWNGLFVAAIVAIVLLMIVWIVRCYRRGIAPGRLPASWRGRLLIAINLVLVLALLSGAEQLAEQGFASAPYVGTALFCCWGFFALTRTY